MPTLQLHNDVIFSGTVDDSLFLPTVACLVTCVRNTGEQPFNDNLYFTTRGSKTKQLRVVNN